MQVQGQGEIKFPSQPTLLIRALGYVNTLSLPLSPLSLSHRNTHSRTGKDRDG